MLSALPMIPPTSNIVDKSADVVGPYRLPPIPRQKEILNKKKNIHRVRVYAKWYLILQTKFHLHQCS